MDYKWYRRRRAPVRIDIIALFVLVVFISALFAVVVMRGGER